MPNRRSEDQKLVPVPMNVEFIRQINEALPKLGYSDRASFIRDAIMEKLQREGVEIPSELAQAPSRVGKGGYPTHRPAHLVLNEEASSYGQDEARAAELLRAAHEEAKSPGPEPTPEAGGPSGAKGERRGGTRGRTKSGRRTKHDPKPEEK